MNQRAKFNEINEEQQRRLAKIREDFSLMYDGIEIYCKPGRETALAYTKLEEAQFWAIKGITREQEKIEEKL